MEVLRSRRAPSAPLRLAVARPGDAREPPGGRRVVRVGVNRLWPSEIRPFRLGTAMVTVLERMASVLNPDLGSGSVRDAPVPGGGRRKPQIPVLGATAGTLSRYRPNPRLAAESAARSRPSAPDAGRSAR